MAASRRTTAPRSPWDDLLAACARLPFVPHDIAKQLDAGGRYEMPLDDEFPFAISLFHYRTDLHTRGSTWHERLELFVPVEGRTLFRMGEREFDLRPGDLLVVDNLKLHHVVDFDGFDSRAVVVSFRPEFVYSLGSPSHDYTFLMPFYAAAARRARVLPLPEHPEAADALRRLVLCRFEEPDGALQRAGCKAFLLQLLLELARRFRVSELAHWEFLRQQQRTLRLKPLFDHVREHYAEKLSVADAAALARMSAPQFMKTFKKVAGTTLVAYLNHVRLANGSRLLRETSLSVAEIASAVGFADQSYFDKRFKRAFGRTPMAFRVGSPVEIVVSFDGSVLARAARVPYRGRLHALTPVVDLGRARAPAGLRRGCDSRHRPAAARAIRPRFAAAAAGLREHALPGHRGRAPVLLAGRHGVGAVSPADPRGGGALPAQPRRAALHRHPGRRAGRARRARRSEPVRRAAADRSRPDQAERALLRARRLDRRQGQRPRALRRAAADVGRQVEQEVGRRPRDLHAGERRDLRRVARPALSRRGHRLDPRRRSAGRERRAPGHHRGDGARPARRRRRGPPDHVPPDRRTELLGAVPRRGVARLQHAAERPRRRVHRTLRPDARRLRPHADQAGPRRRADLRGPSDRLQAEGARALARRRRAAPALLEPVHRRLRPHLRPSLGVADVAARAEADQRSAAAVERGHRPARRGADAARAGAARIAALPHPDPRDRRDRGGSRRHERARRRPLCRRRHARRGRQLRDGLRAGRPALHGAARRDRRREGPGVVVQPADRHGGGRRDVRDLGRPPVHAARSWRSPRLGPGPRRRRQGLRPARPDRAEPRD